MPHEPENEDVDAGRASAARNQRKCGRLLDDADLTLGPPTKLAAVFGDGDGFYSLGHVYLKTGQDIFTTVRVNDEDPGFDGDADGSYTLSTTVAPTPVPEPASLLFVGSVSPPSPRAGAYHTRRG